MNTIGIGQTDIGRRRERNEDKHLVDNALGLYVVCDGMGGHAAGEVASAAAIETVAAAIRDERPLLEQLTRSAQNVAPLIELAKSAVERACREVHQLATSKAEYHGMGCTLTMVIVAGSKAVMAHVGDTRLYLTREGSAHLLSTDHTMAAELARMGSIKPEDVKNHPYAHVLTRALGPQASVQVDTLLLELMPGDRLLLCSDGLTEYVADPSWLAARMTAADIESVPDELIAFANEAGGRDNITAVVVGVDADPAAPPDALHADVQLRLETLGSVFLFEELPLGHLTRVLNACRIHSAAAGDAVITEGDPCAALYVTLEGDLTISRAGGRATQIGVADHFGEATVMNPRRCRATVRAIGPAKLLVLEREPLLKLMNTRPWLGVNLLQRLARRLSRDLERLEDHAAFEAWI